MSHSRLLTSSDIQSAAVAARALSSPFDHRAVDEWRSSVMGLLKQLLGADSAGFLLPVPDETLFFSEEIDQSVLTSFPEYPPPPLIDGHSLEQRMLELQVATVGTGYGEHFDRYLDSSYNHEYATPARAHDTLAAVLSLPGNEVYETANLHFWHARPHGPRFGEREVTLLRLLYPAFEAGVHAVTRLHARRRALESSLDAGQDGALVYDLQGRLLYRSRPVGRMAIGRRAERALTRAGREMAMNLRAGEPRGLLQAHASVRTFNTDEGTLELHAALLREGTFGLRPSVLITVSDGAAPLPDRDALRARFGLTRRQAQIALLLAERKTNPEIAEQLCISQHTVRSHAEAVMGKLGLHDRREIRRELASA